MQFLPLIRMFVLCYIPDWKWTGCTSAVETWFVVRSILLDLLLSYRNLHKCHNIHDIVLSSVCFPAISLSQGKYSGTSRPVLLVRFREKILCCKCVGPGACTVDHCWLMASVIVVYLIAVVQSYTPLLYGNYCRLFHSCVYIIILCQIMSLTLWL